MPTLSHFHHIAQYIFRGIIPQDAAPLLVPFLAPRSAPVRDVDDHVQDLS